MLARAAHPFVLAAVADEKAARRPKANLGDANAAVRPLRKLPSRIHLPVLRAQSVAAAEAGPDNQESSRSLLGNFVCRVSSLAYR